MKHSCTLLTACIALLMSSCADNQQQEFTDGVNFSQMRTCHMYAGADEISFGVYACSPEESSFTAVFTDMKITECMWKAHDGQQPDAE